MGIPSAQITPDPGVNSVYLWNGAVNTHLIPNSSASGTDKDVTLPNTSGTLALVGQSESQELYHDFTNKSNGAVASTADSGQTWTQTYTRVAGAPTVSSGRYTNTDAASGSSAGYLTTQLSATATWLEAEFEFGATGSSSGQAFAMVAWVNNLPSGTLSGTNDAPAHVVFTASNVQWGYFSGGSLNIIAIIPYSQTYTTELQRVAVGLDKETGKGWVLCPNGIVYEVAHSSISSMTASNVCFETYYTAADSDKRVSVRKVGADSTPMTAHTAERFTKAQTLRQTGAGISNQFVEDQKFTLHDGFNKFVKFELNGIAAGNTRTLTIPDANTTITGTDAVQTLTNKTLTDPKVNVLKDTNGNTIAALTATASAVNYLNISNAATTGIPYLGAIGSDTNIGINLIPKGTGSVYIYADSTVTPTLSSIGPDTNIDFNITAKGSGKVKTTGNFAANAYMNGFTTTATSAGTTTLTATSTGIQEFTGTTTHTVKLPTTSIIAGMQYTILNQSTGAVTVQSSGSNTITVLAAGTSAIFTSVVSTPTTAANWDSQYIGAGGGDTSSNTATSVDSEVALFSGTAGKTIKRATGTGLATLTSGVLSTVTAPTGAVVGTTDAQAISNKTATLSAGSTTVAPLKFTSGVNLTTAAAGAIEYDGTVFYATAAASTRQVADAEQFTTLTTAYTLTSQTAAQKLFNTSTNGAVTLAAGTYFCECFYTLSAMSTATAGSFGFALAGTATVASQLWQATANKAVLATPAATATTSVNTAANVAIAPSNTTATGWARICGKVRISAGGTIIPQVSLGVAAPAVVGVDSYFRIWSVGASSATIVGNWS